MTGALMQLVAYGAQDIYLTGNPTMSFFKTVYKKHTNFSFEIINNTSITNNLGGQHVVSISRHGDLISKMYLKIKMHANVSSTKFKWAWVKNLGYSIIDTVDIEIGGQTIDTHYGNFLNIYHELYKKDDHGKSWDSMVGNSSSNNELNYSKQISGSKEVNIFVPLQFWFNKENSIALPMIALQYHEAKIKINFKKIDSFYVKEDIDSEGNPTTVIPELDHLSVPTKYIFLDCHERKSFAQHCHEYLIEQVQHISDNIITASKSIHRQPLYFNHPVKSLLIVNRLDKYSYSSGKYFLGNDLISATKNFIIRYCLCGIKSADLAQILAGNSLQFYIDKNHQINVLAEINGTIDEGDTQENINLVKEFTSDNTLNDSHANYYDIIKVISAAKITWHGELEKILDEDQNNGNINTELLWNSIEVPVTLPASICSLDIDTLETLNLPANTSIFKTNAISPNNIKGGKFTLSNNCLFGLNIDGSGDTLSSLKISANGSDLQQKMEAQYHKYVATWDGKMNSPDTSIYVYNFALNPLDLFPSGSLNFSRIDNSNLTIDSIKNNPKMILDVYALNHNVLRIMNGMAGISFSN